MAQQPTTQDDVSPIKHEPGASTYNQGSVEDKKTAPKGKGDQDDVSPIKHEPGASTYNQGSVEDKKTAPKGKGDQDDVSPIKHEPGASTYKQGPVDDKKTAPKGKGDQDDVSPIKHEPGVSTYKQGSADDKKTAPKGKGDQDDVSPIKHEPGVSTYKQGSVNDKKTAPKNKGGDGDGPAHAHNISYVKRSDVSAHRTDGLAAIEGDVKGGHLVTATHQTRAVTEELRDIAKVLHVNVGAGDAALSKEQIEAIQEKLNVKKDGKVGQQTLDAMEEKVHALTTPSAPGLAKGLSVRTV